MSTTDRWSTPRLAAFLAAITGAADEESAMRRAVDWATDALEAEIGIILEGATTVASVGFSRGTEATAVLHAAVVSGVDTLDLAGLGMCRLAWAPIELESAGHLAVVRAGPDDFSREETALLRAAARSLTLTLRLLRALSGERAMRDSLQKRQALLERLSHIQRGITRRLPLADVLQTITSGARDLLDVEVAAVRLVDPDSPGDLYIAASEGLGPEVVERIRRSKVGTGVGGRAIAENRLVSVEDYENAPQALAGLADQHLKYAMAAPVHDGDLVTGSITIATTDPRAQFGVTEKEALVAFAEHASLALTDAKRVEHIQKLAFHDSLTGLANRPLFIERLERALTRARRRHSDIAVLFMDLDRFKTVNDSLGHDAGDQLLIAVAQRLAGCLREEDTAARLGGDEFAILAHCDRSGAHEVAARIGAVMEAPFIVSGREVSASISIGIALDRGGPIDAAAMLRDADTAMYGAKLRGWPGFVFFEPSMHQAAVARIDREADLRRSITRDEMRLHYQPVVRLSDGQVVGVEALIRWQHKANGLIAPLDFIPLAEETGQIAAIGRWTLQQACTQARLWHRAGSSRLSVSINVSPFQLQNPRFVSEVADAINRTEIDPTRLVIEITESAVMSDAATAIQRLGELRDLGASIAIDDFGTGYSSLGLLRRLPVDTIKVDKLFVDNVAADATAAAFLETIVRMASILSMVVIVEGIETAEQAAVVASLGQVYAQGFHFARPMETAAVDNLLATGGPLYLGGDTAPNRAVRPRLVSLANTASTGG